MAEILVPKEVLLFVEHLADTIVGRSHSVEDLTNITHITIDPKAQIWEFGLTYSEGPGQPHFPRPHPDHILTVQNRQGLRQEPENVNVRFSLYESRTLDEISYDLVATAKRTKARMAITETRDEELVTIRRALLVVHFTSYFTMYFARSLVLPGTEYGNSFGVLTDGNLQDITGFCLNGLMPDSKLEQRAAKPDEIKPVPMLKIDKSGNLHYNVRSGIPLERILPTAHDSSDLSYLK